MTGARAIELSIVMPAYNEEANIARSLDAAIDVGERLADRYEVVIVDDGSRDRTVDIVEEYSAKCPFIRLIRHPTNCGYGDALRSGLQAAQLDLVFFTDADNQFVMSELASLLPWIEYVDVVAGFRAQRQDPFARRLNAKLWNALVRVLFYVPVRDIDCAFKLFRREVLEDLQLEAMGAMVNTELMVCLARSGKSVVEIGVTHLPRTAGTARGANLRVIITAFSELRRMYTRLKTQHWQTATNPLPPRAR
jgi:glycosyltransferase involved in cell wall biosynthesis